MAEPMGSNEIEDVLSSIRRLVAQDLNPVDRAKLAAVADISNKLVLSPESRVLSDEASAKFVTVRRPSRRAAFPAIDEVLPTMDGTAQGGAHAERDWSLGETSAADFVAPQPKAFLLNPESRLSDVAPEAFETNFEPNYDQALAAVPEQEYEEDLNELTPQDMHHWPEDTHTATEPQSFHGTIEPDADWANEAEARVLAELAGEAVTESVVYAANSERPEPSFGQKSSAIPSSFFDEDELRQLIQKIFREEMAGPMGERITRNIRKLVRAEVGRMLAAQDLE